MIVDVDVKNFLPENVSAMGDTNIKVTLKVEALDKKSVTLTIGDLEIKGSRTGVSTNIIPERITVVVSGLSANLEAVSNSDIKATLDVSKMTAGANNGTLTFELPTGLSVDSYTPFEVMIGSPANERNETTTTVEQSSSEESSPAAEN